jgi:radical SAM-linked protein
MRFCSHRDFARAFERALRRAEIPMAYSAGFHPHPKISYAGAAPTGVASEAEYLEIGLSEHRNPDTVRIAIDTVLPDGLDIVEAIDASESRPGALSEYIDASFWRLEFRDNPSTLQSAVQSLLAHEAVVVERLTKDGRREVDARAPIVTATVHENDGGKGHGDSDEDCHAILDLVVRQVTPSVRPDDVLAALITVAGFAPSRPPRATRLAQGPVGTNGAVGNPLSAAPVTEAPQPEPSTGNR